MAPQKEIAIIGGGFTGLTAAYYLSQKNYKVTIFEREKFLGGLAAGFKIEGRSIEKAYHHIFPSDKYIIQLVGELGLTNKLHWLDSSVALYSNKRIFPFSGALDLLKFSALNIIDRIRTGLIIFFLSKFKFMSNKHIISAYDWLNRWAGKSSMRVIWEPLLKGKFHKYYKDISIPWLWARLHTRASSRKIWEKSEKLGYFDGGFELIVETLIDRLKNFDVEIRTETGVKRIGEGMKNEELRIKNGMEKEIVNRIDVEFDDEVRSFDSVIATTPSHIFSKLIGEENYPDYSQQLNSTNYLGAVTLVFSSDQDLGKYYWTNVNDLEFPFLVFINHTKLAPKEWYKGKNIYYLGAYIPHDHKYFEIEGAEIIKEWFLNLKKIFPEFDENKIGEKHLFKFKNAQHVVTKSYPESIAAIETPLRNVYLSNFSQIYPEDRGTNFAVREGMKIVKLIEDKLAG